MGFEVGGMLSQSETPTGPIDLLILGVCAVVGSAIGLRLKLSAPTFIGTTAFSAVAHIMGLTYGSSPIFLVITDQFVLGVIVGCRFKGSRPMDVFHALKLAVVSTAVMLALAAWFASAVHQVTGYSTAQLLLAYAPRGLNERSPVSLAIQADIAFVATHHLVRIIMLLALAETILDKIAAH